MAYSSEMSERTLKAALKRCRKELIDGVSLEDVERCIEKASFLSEKEWVSLKKSDKQDQMDKLLDHLGSNVATHFGVFVHALEESCHSELSTLLKHTACLLHHENDLLAIEANEAAALLRQCTASLSLSDSNAVRPLPGDADKFKFLLNELLPRNVKYFQVFTTQLRKTHGSLAKRMRQLAGTDEFIRDSKDLSHSTSVRIFRAKHRSSGVVRLVREYELSSLTAEEARQAHATLLKLQATLVSVGLNYIQKVEKSDTTLTLLCDFYSEPSLEKQLHDAETEKEAFEEDEVVHILQDAIRTLRKLHQSGVVHGNITPSCVIRDDKGEMQLVDIRIQGLHKLQDTKLVVAAPEVRHGQQPTTASDIWSLGAVAYRMLAGKDPPERTNRRHLFPRGTGVSRKLKKLVKKMLRNDPNRRPSTDRVLESLSEPSNIVRRFTLRITKMGRTMRDGVVQAFSLPRDATSIAAFQETLQRMQATEGGAAVECGDEPRECLAVVVFEEDGSVETMLYDDVNNEWIRWNENVVDGKSGKKLVVHSTSCFVPLDANRGVVVDTANKQTYWSDDLQGGGWSKVDDAPHRCFGASGVKRGDTVYVIGGSKDEDGTKPVDCMMRFSVSTRKWIPSVTWPQATRDPAIALCSHWILAIGGKGSDGLPMDKVQYIGAEDSTTEVVWLSEQLKPLLKSRLSRHKLSLLEPMASTVVCLPHAVYRVSCLESHNTPSVPKLRMNELAPSLGECETTVTYGGNVATVRGNVVRLLHDDKSVTDLPILPLHSDAVRSFVALLSGDIALQ